MGVPKGFKRVGEKRYTYRGWMVTHHTNSITGDSWVLGTTWDYSTDEHGMAMRWFTSRPGSTHALMRGVKINVQLRADHWAPTVRATWGDSVKKLADCIDALEGDGHEGLYDYEAVYPVFSNADIYYLKTEKQEDIPLLLAKWPASKQLQELLNAEV